MDIQYGRPFTGRRLEELRAFLKTLGLDYDDRVQFTVLCTDEEGDPIATGSLDGNVFKCIGVAEAHQGEGLTATVITELRREAFDRGQAHLFLFTKPSNRAQFADMAFFPIASTKDVLLMESRRNAARDYARSLAEEAPAKADGGPGEIGAIVMNANPFTAGHRYLIETALKRVGLLHVFVVSEDRSYFSFEERFRRVLEGTKDLPAVRVHETKQYMISSLTFPTYFIKDKARAEDVRCGLDLAVFADVFAREMGITVRFVGTEPLDPVTARYNEIMKETLPKKGIEVVEVPRLTINGEIVSATKVREALQRK
ncbi:MAG: [citrate (pro-3S)-lyase] ligase [Clostridia bacterium]|nr:[citrate (pro-3S)-lyase] ligase [Clostridia bacterium]